MRRALAIWLERAGYRITQAPDGETAIELLETDTFDVVLTDIVMGDVDGIEVLYTARIQPYRPEVILLTGHGSLETSLLAFRQGAYDYLLKPFDEDELLDSVVGALQRRESEQQLMQATAHLFPSIFRKVPNRGNMPLLPPKVNATGLHATTRTPPMVPADEPLTIGELMLGSTRHEVTFQGKRVRLTPIEFALLHYLAQHCGEVCPCPELVRYTHGLQTADSDAQALLRPHIYNLRKKLDPAYLVTDRGVGYALINPEGDAGEETPET
jgi:DNA-binding response OmpR family regulator